jgi:hypothetical protein
LSTDSAPRVFVSHASEDKERFVIPFATALRERGVDAWVDQWEMQIGDSLVDKIFEEGLRGAAAVLIVLSDASIRKPWVREELNTAVVARIKRGAKLIPIILDNCEVPESLTSLVYEPVNDVENFEDCLVKVVDTIFGHTRRPPIGAPPAYALVAASGLSIRGLTQADSVVLGFLYERFLSVQHEWVEPEAVVLNAAGRELDSSIVSDCLEILENLHYVRLLKHLGPGLPHAQVTPLAVAAILGHEEAPLVRAIGLAILNDGLSGAREISAAVGQPQALVSHAMDRLVGNGHIKVTRPLSGDITVYHRSASLRRFLDT